MSTVNALVTDKWIFGFLFARPAGISLPLPFYVFIYFVIFLLLLLIIDIDYLICLRTFFKNHLFKIFKFRICYL